MYWISTRGVIASKNYFRSSLCLRPENLFSRPCNTHATMLSEILANKAEFIRASGVILAHGVSHSLAAIVTFAANFTDAPRGDFHVWDETLHLATLFDATAEPRKRLPDFTITTTYLLTPNLPTRVSPNTSTNSGLSERWVYYSRHHDDRKFIITALLRKDM